MMKAKITCLTRYQYDNAYAKAIEHSGSEVYLVNHDAGLVAAKHLRHPEHGEIILISSAHEGCLMIHV